MVYRLSRDILYSFGSVIGGVIQRSTMVDRWIVRSISRNKVEQKKTIRRCSKGTIWTYSPERALLMRHFLPFRSSFPGYRF
jgi:hypothetical protein